MIGGVGMHPTNTFSGKKSAASAQTNPFRFQNRLIDAAIQAQGSLNGKHATIYMNCLVSQVSGSGQELHMKYDESSTEENPVIYVWGKDLAGEEFETKIYVNEIDPYNASPAEMKALHAHLARQEGGVKTESVALDVSLNGYDANQKINFVQYLQEWNDMQALAKNPAADLERLQLEQYLDFQKQSQNAREVVAQYQQALEREMMYRSSHPIQSGGREKEEPVLFADESRSVFDVKKFLEILGVELDGEFNENADGTGKLTEEQIRYFKEKYDVQNLTKSEFYNMLAELSNANAISYEDVKNLFVRQANPAVVESGYMISGTDERFSWWFQDEDGYLSRFQKEILAYDDLILALMNGKTSVDTSELSAVRDYYERQKAFSSTLVEILEQIKR